MEMLHCRCFCPRDKDLSDYSSEDSDRKHKNGKKKNAIDSDSSNLSNNRNYVSDSDIEFGSTT